MEDEKKAVCMKCGREIDPETDDYEEIADDCEGEECGLLCEECMDKYAQCEMCGRLTLVEDLTYWGDVQICPDCLDAECPGMNFDEEWNIEQTTEAYEAMKARYVGRKAENHAGETLEMTMELDEPCVTYSMEVTFDEDGVITDVSRLSAVVLLSEGCTSSDRRPYEIDEDDYEWVADDMFDNNVDFADGD